MINWQIKYLFFIQAFVVPYLIDMPCSTLYLTYTMTKYINSNKNLINLIIPIRLSDNEIFFVEFYIPIKYLINLECEVKT